MYEELVSALRNCGFPNSYHYCKNCVFAGKYGGSCDLKKLLPEAADAIEELTDRNVGKWIPIKGETGVEAFGFKENTVIAFFCSNCEEDVDVSEGDFNFCPHCGAKMEVPTDV